MVIHTSPRARSLLSFALLAVIFYLVARVADVVFPNPPVAGKVSPDKLMQQFRTIAVPASHSLNGRAESFDRGDLTVAGAQFHASETQEIVFHYYLNSLPVNGWEFESRSQKQIKFCRKGVSLVVDTIPAADGVIYFLGVGWAKNPKSYAYCRFAP